MPINRRHFRRLEAPAGTGTLHDGSRCLATVTYALTVLQEIVGSGHRDGDRAHQGQRQVRGRLRVIAGLLPVGAPRLTLRLDDGRSLPFVATGSGPVYTIEPGSTLRVDA